MILCSLNSLLVYLYQFKNDDFIKSIFNVSSDNFFSKNLPNIGFSIYLKDNLYFNFLPHFGLTFLSVLFINEIKRQLKNMKNIKLVRKNTITILNKKKQEINDKLKDEDLSEEDRELLQSDKYEENEKILKYLAVKYFFVTLMKLFSEFYWLFLFISIGIIFSFYDLSFSMVIYIIIFGIFFILKFYRRITKLTKYINKEGGSYFISKVVRYTFVEKPVSEKINRYYRSIALKFLLSYCFIFLIILYLYGVFDLFQHGCNDSFFKGCEKSNEPIFEPDGNAENYIKAFAYLFGIYVDIRNQGLIEVAWVHILLSILIGFDVYSQKLLNKYTLESINIKKDILDIKNENNILYDYYRYKDIFILIKICLKIAGISSSEEERQKMRDAYNESHKEEEEKEKQAKIEEKKEEEKKIENMEKIFNQRKEEIKDILKANKFLENKDVKKFLSIFFNANDNEQTLNKTNNNSTKLIWFLKKMVEELIIVLLICIALTKQNILSFIYFIYFAYLTTTIKTMLKFYILYCTLLILVILQSIIYITNISEDTNPKINQDLLTILKDKLNIPWYINNYNIEKKYAFFYGLGVNKIQSGLLLLEYILIIIIYIYLDYFSFSIYQDIKNKGEEEPEKLKFNYEAVKLSPYQKEEIKRMDEDLLIQYRECLKNFDVDIQTKNLNKMLEIKERPDCNPKMKLTNKNLDQLLWGKAYYYKSLEYKKKNGDNNIPDSDFIKAFQEFIYLYLHIFFLFFIIIVSIMIPGLISIFYLLICFYYLIHSHYIYLGLKYGYPKQIKKLIKICLIADIALQLIYQIPYISSEDNIFDKIFNALGFSKLLNYLDNSDIEFSSSSILEIIGKPLIYLIISLQTIIYNSNDFKKYYLIFLLTLKDDIKNNGIVNSYIFNNSRIQEFNNSVDLRIKNEMEMDEIKNIILEWNEKLKKEEENDKLYEKPKIEPLKYMKLKRKEKEIKKDKEENIENKKEEIIIENEDKNEEKEKIDQSENKKEEKKNDKLKYEQSEGLIPFYDNLNKKKYRKLLTSEEIRDKITKMLLSGKLLRFYLWFNSKSSYFKSMNGNEQLNFQIESFIGTVITRSFIENQILDSLKMFDLSNFNEKEFSVLEDFIMKFKKGKLKKELNKIKDEIRKEKLEKYKLNNNLIRKDEEINTNLNDKNIINLNN